MGWSMECNHFNPGPARIFPAFANSVDPDQKLTDMKKSTDLDLHCLSFSLWIFINNLDQVIWLADN